MTTTIPSGLGATLGLGAEAANSYGAGGTIGRWYMIDPSEGFSVKKNVAQSKAIHGGRFMVGKRRVVPTKAAVGKFDLDLVSKGLGLLFKNGLGSAATAVQQSSSTAYLQQHVPGLTQVGQSLVIQKGIPMTPSGTIQPFTYAGCTITDWEISCTANEIAKLSITVDAQSEVTATSYTAPTFTAAEVFHFAEGGLLIGGTPTTSGGFVSISGGTAPTAVVSSVSVKGSTKLNTSRYNIGASTKSEPVENAFCEVTGTIELEFATLTDFYTAMIADTQQALQITFTGSLIASTYHNYVNILIPNAVFEDATPQATSTDVVKVKLPFTTLDDLTDPPVEIDYMSTDTAV